MRIISGHLGGRKIQPPSKMPKTRPTTDIAKTGLFNTLNHLIDFTDDMRSLDLFGGTGCISYELCSRGVEDLTIVEMDLKMFEFIKQTSQQLGIASHFKYFKMDVFKFMAQCQERFDFIFAGPPYALTTIDDIPDRVIEKPLLTDRGIFVLEHTPRNNYEDHPNFFKLKNYGTTLFSFFKLHTDV